MTNPQDQLYRAVRDVASGAYALRVVAASDHVKVAAKAAKATSRIEQVKLESTARTDRHLKH